jgi:nucleotide-binding universal stress UspA family protein
MTPTGDSKTKPASTGRRIYLVATDGSPSSERTLAFAVERAQESKALLVVAMAVFATPIGAPSSGGGEDLDLAGELAKEAGRIVGAEAGKARALGVETQAEVIRGYPGEDVAASIVKFAEKRGVHTIFVGAHRGSGIVAKLLGSTAEKVVKIAHCHVSVVR